MSSQINESNHVELLHKKVQNLLQQNVATNAIINELLKEGISADYAALIIRNVLEDKSSRKNFWRLIFGGLFFILGGLAINIFSYRMSANSGSGFFYVFWGIVAAGILMIARAFIIFRK